MISRDDIAKIRCATVSRARPPFVRAIISEYASEHDVTIGQLVYSTEEECRELLLKNLHKLLSPEIAITVTCNSDGGTYRFSIPLEVFCYQCLENLMLKQASTDQVSEQN